MLTYRAAFGRGSQYCFRLGSFQICHDVIGCGVTSGLLRQTAPVGAVAVDQHRRPGGHLVVVPRRVNLVATRRSQGSERRRVEEHREEPDVPPGGVNDVAVVDREVVAVRRDLGRCPAEAHAQGLDPGRPLLVERLVAIRAGVAEQVVGRHADEPRRRGGGRRRREGEREQDGSCEQGANDERHFQRVQTSGAESTLSLAADRAVWPPFRTKPVRAWRFRPAEAARCAGRRSLARPHMESNRAS